MPKLLKLIISDDITLFPLFDKQGKFIKSEPSPPSLDDFLNNNNTSHLLDPLPTELILSIFEYLPDDDLLTLRKVSSIFRFYYLEQFENVWMNRLSANNNTSSSFTTTTQHTKNSCNMMWFQPKHGTPLQAFLYYGKMKQLISSRFSFSSLIQTTTTIRNSNNNNKKICKMVCVGPSEAGKTTFIDQLIPHLTTIGNQYRSANVLFNESNHHGDTKFSNYELAIWDTPGENRFAAISKSSLTKPHCMIFMFDVNSMDSFVQMKRSFTYWKSRTMSGDLNSYLLEENSGNDGMGKCVLFIGTKVDLGKRQVFNKDLALFLNTLIFPEKSDIDFKVISLLKQVEVSNHEKVNDQMVEELKSIHDGISLHGLRVQYFETSILKPSSLYFPIWYAMSVLLGNDLTPPPLNSM